ncbi:MAG: hypothetical protein Q4B54_12625 [Coriobacteriales bacterium]|nr:hypothetical protein [Coriobacteriales bacterium]
MSATRSTSRRRNQKSLHSGLGLTRLQRVGIDFLIFVVNAVLLVLVWLTMTSPEPLVGLVPYVLLLPTCVAAAVSIAGTGQLYLIPFFFLLGLSHFFSPENGRFLMCLMLPCGVSFIYALFVLARVAVFGILFAFWNAVGVIRRIRGASHRRADRLKGD